MLATRRGVKLRRSQRRNAPHRFGSPRWHSGHRGHAWRHGLASRRLTEGVRDPGTHPCPADSRRPCHSLLGDSSRLRSTSWAPGPGSSGPVSLIRASSPLGNTCTSTCRLGCHPSRLCPACGVTRAVLSFLHSLTHSLSKCPWAHLVLICHFPSFLGTDCSQGDRPRADDDKCACEKRHGRKRGPWWRAAAPEGLGTSLGQWSRPGRGAQRACGDPVTAPAIHSAVASSQVLCLLGLSHAVTRRVPLLPPNQEVGRGQRQSPSWSPEGAKSCSDKA